MDFFDWKKRIEIIVYGLTTFHLDDLPDEDFRIHYDTGTTFQKMAEYIINNNNLKDK